MDHVSFLPIEMTSKKQSKNDDAILLFGTPLDNVEDSVDDKHYSGELRQKKDKAKEKEQYVLDEQGRRRFHGAFTGGFSAGYYNTVDTPGGWTPKTFVSKRNERADKFEQNPEDYMDKEDVDEFGIAPRMAETRQEFKERKDNEGSFLRDLLVCRDISKGESILMQGGWKPGTGIGPRVQKGLYNSISTSLVTLPPETSTSPSKPAKKVYGCPLPPGFKPPASVLKRQAEERENDVPIWGLAPNDIEAETFSPKTDLHCLGYTGSLSQPATTSISSNEKGLFEGERGHFNLFGDLKIPDVQKKTKQKLGFKGHAFGIGALEEEDDMEDDPYQDKKKESYDFTTGPAIEAAKANMGKRFAIEAKPVVTGKINIEGFTRARKKLASKITYPMPSIPTGWKPKRRGDKDIEAITETRKRGRSRFSDSKPRGTKEDDRRNSPEYLPPPSKRTKPSRFSDRSEPSEKPKTPPPPEPARPEASPTVFAKAKPLQQAMNEMFKNRFVAEGEGESLESAKVVDEAQEAAKMKMFGAMTRKVLPWLPDRVLCKRFNVKFHDRNEME